MWCERIHTHTHKSFRKSFRVLGKCILFQLNDPKNPTPTVPHSEQLTFSVPVFVPHTEGIRVGGNIDPNPPPLSSFLFFSDKPPSVITVNATVKAFVD